LKWQSSR